MKGINPAYYDEFQAVKNIAHQLNVPYYIEEVKLKGKHMYIEHPMKNMLIANGAIQYCLDRDMPINIAFGNYASSRLNEMEFEIDGGDSRDMWNIYEDIVRHDIPEFKIHLPLLDVSDTYKILINEENLLSDCISCMSPYRFRKHWAERTQKKYHVRLLPNRCGCCWKCCMEYIVLADNHILSYNHRYYIYCLNRLKEIALKEVGVKHATYKEIWNRYFWYDMENSFTSVILEF